MTYEVKCGDCLELLPSIPSGSIDAVITDPPYNVGLNYSGGDNRTDYEQWCGAWFAELQRVCNGPIAISCGIANIAMWQRIVVPTWVFAWVKPNSMKRVATGWNTWEPVLLYGKIAGKKTHDHFIVSMAGQKDTGDHPCPKPKGWAIQLIDRLTKPGATILDPFLGSGTTGVAAMLEGRNFIGIEIDPHYCDIARQRIANVQPTLVQPC